MAGLLRRAIHRRATIESPNVPLALGSEWLIDWTEGKETTAGARVNESTALNLAAVWACLRVRAETFAQLPMIVFERTGEGERAEAREHPAYDLLKTRPNPDSSSLTLREAVQVHVDSWGNGYLEIVRAPGGAIEALEVRSPDRTRRAETARGWYLYNSDPGQIAPRAIRGEDMIHIPGLGWDGISGYSVIQMHRESIGYATAVRDYGSRYIANNAKPSGVVSIPGKVKDPVADTIQARMEQKLAGENAHRVAVLGGGATWAQIGLSPDDSQFIETADLTTLLICRIFRTPPHKIQHLKEAGDRANVEQENLSFLTDTMLPIFRRWEQELDAKLFTGAERGRFYVKVNVNALLRGDFKTRMEGYQIGRNMGIWHADEIRAMEEENPIGAEDGGEIRVIPMNMSDLSAVNAPPPPGPPIPREGERALDRRAIGLRRKTRDAYAKLIRDAAERIVGPEVRTVRKASRTILARRDASELRGWLEDFYRKHADRVERTMLPVLLTFAEQIGEIAAGEVGGRAIDLEDFARRFSNSFALRYTDGHRGQLFALLKEGLDGAPIDRIEKRLGEWEERDPEKIARRESVQGGSAFAKAVWVGLGVTLFRWITFGPCPLCATLDGRVVGVSQAFVEKGSTVDPGGGGAALRVTRSHGHPPLHDGCECEIAPG